MKVDYRVELKETGLQGQAVEEFGSAGSLKVRVYWGTTKDSREPVRHYKVHNKEDLRRI